MFKETIISEKPADKQWNKALTVDVIDYIKNNYVQTGKLLCKVHIFYGDSQKTINIFDSEFSCDQYLTDSNLQLWFTQLATHRQLNNITITSSVRETIDETDLDWISYENMFVAIDENKSIIDNSNFIK